MLEPKSRSLSTTEFFTIMVVITILAALLLPKMQTFSSNSRKQHFKNQLKFIALALHEYQDDFGCLPPAIVKDEQGEPMHSWRAVLIPYLQTKPLFEDCALDYRFDEPWNSPHNQQIAERFPTLFRGDWTIPETETAPREQRNSKLVAVVDDCTYWSENQTRRLGQDRILLLEVPELPGLWNEPADISLDELTALSLENHFEPRGAFALFDDGHVKWFPSAVFNPGYLENLVQAP